MEKILLLLILRQQRDDSMAIYQSCLDHFHITFILVPIAFTDYQKEEYSLYYQSKWHTSSEAI